MFNYFKKNQFKSNKPHKNLAFVAILGVFIFSTIALSFAINSSSKESKAAVRPSNDLSINNQPNTNPKGFVTIQSPAERESNEGQIQGEYDRSTFIISNVKKDILDGLKGATELEDLEIGTETESFIEFKSESLASKDQQEFQDILYKAVDFKNTTDYADQAVVQPNYIYYSQAVPNDQYYSYQWGLKNTGSNLAQYNVFGTPGVDINAEQAWDVTRGNANTVIAVLDDGFDLSHPDLAPNFLNGYDFFDNDSNPGLNTPEESHGTHVAGIAAAKGFDGIGVAGVCSDCKILPVKVMAYNSALGTSTSTTTSLVQGLDYAISRGSEVINLSLGSYAYDSQVAASVKKALDNNIVVVSAAGNDGQNLNVYPAALMANGHISVGAIDQNGNRASFSNYGSQVDLAAPGTNILSDMPNSSLNFKSGTSMATPFVAGIAGLIKSQNPNLTPSQIEQAMISTAKIGKLNPEQMGAGLVDARAALEASTKTNSLPAGVFVFCDGSNAYVDTNSIDCFLTSRDPNKNKNLKNELSGVKIYVGNSIKNGRAFSAESGVNYQEDVPLADFSGNSFNSDVIDFRGINSGIQSGIQSVYMQYPNQTPIEIDQIEIKGLVANNEAYSIPEAIYSTRNKSYRLAVNANDLVAGELPYQKTYPSDYNNIEILENPDNLDLQYLNGDIIFKPELGFNKDTYFKYRLVKNVANNQIHKSNIAVVGIQFTPNNLPLSVSGDNIVATPNTQKTFNILDNDTIIKPIENYEIIFTKEFTQPYTVNAKGDVTYTAPNEVGYIDTAKYKIRDKETNFETSEAEIIVEVRNISNFFTLLESCLNGIYRYVNADFNCNSRIVIDGDEFMITSIKFELDNGNTVSCGYNYAGQTRYDFDYWYGLRAYRDWYGNIIDYNGGIMEINCQPIKSSESGAKIAKLIFDGVQGQAVIDGSIYFEEFKLNPDTYTIPSNSSEDIELPILKNDTYDKKEYGEPKTVKYECDTPVSNIKDPICTDEDGEEFLSTTIELIDADPNIISVTPAFMALLFEKKMTNDMIKVNPNLNLTGQYTFKYKAYPSGYPYKDHVQPTTVTLNFQSSNTAPTISSVTPESSAIEITENETKDLEILAQASDPDNNIDRVELSYSIENNSGIISENTVSMAVLSADANKNGTYAYTIAGLKSSDKMVNLSVKAFDSKSAESTPISRSYKINTLYAPVVKILNPEQNKTYRPDKTIQASISVTDGNGIQDLAKLDIYINNTIVNTITEFSADDPEGKTDNIIFNLPQLTETAHSLKVIATDKANKISNTDLVIFLIQANKAPSISIDTPAEGENTFEVPFSERLNNLKIETTVSDYEDDLNGQPLNVSIDFDGKTYNQEDIDLTDLNLAPGTYTITAKVTDSEGSQTTATRDVIVVEADEVNIAPKANSSEYEVDENNSITIDLADLVSDPNITSPNKDITSYSIDSYSGLTQNGSLVTFNAPEVAGDQQVQIYYTATDGAGAVSNKASLIFVIKDTTTGTPPVIDIKQPTPDQVFQDTDTISVLLEVDDADGLDNLEKITYILISTSTGGNVTTTPLETILTDGNSNYTFDVESLFAGTHTLEVKAIDKDGFVSQKKSVKFFVEKAEPKENTAPIVNITNPNNGDVFEVEKGQTLTELNIKTDVSDAEDAPNLPKVVISLNGNEQTLNPDGTSSTLTDLAPGIYTITATATDSEGLSTEASITFEVKEKDSSDDDSDFVCVENNFLVSYYNYTKEENLNVKNQGFNYFVDNNIEPVAYDCEGRNFSKFRGSQSPSDTLESSHTNYDASNPNQKVDQGITLVDPNTPVKQNRFVAHYTGEFNFQAVNSNYYNFAIKADDGIIVKLNGKEILNEWKARGYNTYNVDIQVPDGKHTIEVIYREEAGDSTTKVAWYEIINENDKECANNQFKNYFYNNTDLKNGSYIRHIECTSFKIDGQSTDSNILNLNYQKPANASIGSTTENTEDHYQNSQDTNFTPYQVFAANYSIRSVANINLAEKKEYTFNLTSSNQVKLYINDQMVIDGQNSGTHSYTATLQGDVKIVVEYIGNQNSATVELGISSKDLNTNTISPTANTSSSSDVEATISELPVASDLTDSKSEENSSSSITSLDSTETTSEVIDETVKTTEDTSLNTSSSSSSSSVSSLSQ